MNIWFRIDDQLVTPALSDSILGGITRKSILKIASEMNLNVQERNISVEEIVDAFNKNLLLESFGTGTAVSVVPVNSITLGSKKMVIPKQANSYSSILKQKLQDIQYGRENDVYNWTTKF